MDIDTLITEVAGAAVYFIFGGGLVAVVQTIRQDRRKAPKDTSDTLTSILEQAEKATATAVDALRKSTETERKAIAAERRAERAEEMVHVFRHVVAKHIVAIIEWIDRGAEPPPPHIHQELRDFVDDMKGM